MSDWPEKWMDLPLAVLDVETTGLEPQDHRVTEVGIIHFEQGEVVDEYGQLVDPQRPIPEESTEITGISQEDVEGKPTFDDIADTVHEQLQDVGIVAYNLSFDRSFLEMELERCGHSWPDDNPTLDPLIFARQFFKEQRRKDLGTVCDLLGIPLEEAHRATNDARVTGRVLYAFADRLPDNLDDLLMLQAQWEQLQAQEMASWQKQDDDGADSLSDAFGGQTVGLGPAYIYGDENDPLRALYKSVPEAND